MSKRNYAFVALAFGAVALAGTAVAQQLNIAIATGRRSVLRNPAEVIQPSVASRLSDRRK